MMALGFGTSNSLLKRDGTAWQNKWHAVPQNVQHIENTGKLHPPVGSAQDRDFSHKINTLRPTCSLLRQVCGLCGWNSRSSELPASCSGREAAGSLAPARPLPSFLSAGCIALAAAGVLAILAPSTAFADDAWVQGSSFGDGEKHAAGWSQSGFVASREVSWGAADVQADRGSVSRFVFDAGLTPLANLRNLIASAEAGAGGYDAVAYGAEIPPPAKASEMRLGDVRTWVQATPGQDHAIGRYQVIPKTFERLAKAIGSSEDATFDAKLQDRWANVLIEEAGYSAFLAGELSPDAFMDRLAHIWAGLPLGDGRSAYEGIAGNRATISRAVFASAIAQIFPAQAAIAENPKLAFNAKPAKSGP